MHEPVCGKGGIWGCLLLPDLTLGVAHDKHAFLGQRFHLSVAEETTDYTESSPSEQISCLNQLGSAYTRKHVLRGYTIDQHLGVVRTPA